MKAIRVVIVGGGFAAVQFAKNLCRKLPASACEILLFNRENHLVFHPLLADVAGASINADAAAAPLRQMLPGVECRTERVQRINLQSSEIEFDDGTGTLSRSLSPIPGPIRAEQAFVSAGSSERHSTLPA